MWFRKNRTSSQKPEITQSKTVSYRGAQQLDYFKATMNKPFPPAKNGVEVFYGKKKK